MTERTIKWINFGSHLKGLIIVDKFDAKVEEYLKYYEILQRSSNQRLVKDVYTEELFIVVRASENIKGRRTNHMILDNRIEDDIVNLICLPLLVGVNRKVEIF